jgi:alginate O-acetyltransferase complex protein AlgI
VVFSSLAFLYFFLPVSLFFYFLVRSVKIKNFILLIFSFVFYSWGEPVWVILLLISGLLDYGNGLLIERFREVKSVRLFGLLNSIIVNLGLLATFKYSDFIIQNVNFLFGTSFVEPNILLPVGISFYTFQTLSYTIDVYRGEVKPERNLIDFLMFVSLFPQLVAGPIVRYSEIAQQTIHRKFDFDMVVDGASRFCLGLFKKVVLANSVGVLVEKYLNTQFDALSTPEAWFGIVLYSIQLYFDFSGYSDMAIGLGKILGFTFPENFRHPYAATSVANFYQRWHMTLGRFLRDYVYIPLGGNKKYQIRNILVVWFLTGLWHGASWNFVLWGLFLGIFMVFEKVLKKYFDMLPRFALYAYALLVVNYSRAFFYFDDFDKLSVFLVRLFYSPNPIGQGWASDLTSYAFLYVVVILFCIPWNEIYDRTSRINQVATNFYQRFSFVINLIFLLMATALIIDDTYNPFIYFRF